MVIIKRCVICHKRIWGWDEFRIKYASRSIPRAQENYRYDGFFAWRNVKKETKEYAHDRCVIRMAKEKGEISKD
jgi:hypothetical protein